MPLTRKTASCTVTSTRKAGCCASIEAARPALVKNGLSITQLISNEGEDIALETMLIHSSGEWLSSTFKMPLGDEKGRSLAQSMGAVVTYMRRYSLAAILGIYADEDTDGNSKERKAEKEQPASNGHKPAQDTAPVATMSIEAAGELQTKSKKFYKDLTIEELQDHIFGIEKTLKRGTVKNEEGNDVALTDKQREDLQYKRDAAATLLAARQQS